MKLEFDEICNKEAELFTQERLQIMGKNLKKMRLKNHLTQADVAFYIFSDKSLVSALERGVYKNITLLTISKLVLLFKIEIDDLFIK